MQVYPKISIVTPSYNQGQYLEETILSVIGQNYPNLEYIIIDGGSTDNSVEIIKKYEKRLAYWVSEPDAGMYEAIQKGFDRSTGEVMAWLNSDDMYHPRSFFTVGEIFENLKEVDWLTGIPTSFDEKSRTTLVGKSRDWSKYNFYLGDYKWIQQESTFWRRKLWEKSGSRINCNLRLAGDFELWLRFFNYAYLYNVDTLIGGFRYRGSNQKSVDFYNEYIKEAELILKSVSLDEHTSKRIQKIKRVEFLKKKLERIKIGRIEAYFARLFEYPEVVRFDPLSKGFHLVKAYT